jgi:hypothetical protein
MSGMMNPALFEAFRSAGVPDGKARAAATLLARPQMQTADLAIDLATVKTDVGVLKADVSGLKSSVAVLLRIGGVLIAMATSVIAMQASLVAKGCFPHG